MWTDFTNIFSFTGILKVISSDVKHLNQGQMSCLIPQERENKIMEMFTFFSYSFLFSRY